MCVCVLICFAVFVVRRRRRRQKEFWPTFVTEDDIAEIARLGLDTIRIPVGYWM